MCFLGIIIFFYLFIGHSLKCIAQIQVSTSGLHEIRIVQSDMFSSIKVDDYEKIDIDKFKVSKIPPTHKNEVQKTDSAFKAMQKLLDSLMRAKTKITSFDCRNAEATKPLFLGNLNTIHSNVFDVTNSVGVKLDLFGISGVKDKNDILIQANFFIFKDFICADNTDTRALVGMTLYLHISNLKMSLTTKSLPNISAAVQLGKANASYQLRFYGLTESINFKDLPSIGDLNVDNYSKILSAWDKIKDAFDKNSPIDPVIIPNYKTANDF